MIYKICHACLQTKLICEFGKDKYKNDGYSYVCRSCNLLKSKKWFMENKERYNEGARRRYKENPLKKINADKWKENNKELMAKYKKDWLEKNKEKHKKSTKVYLQKNLEKRKKYIAKWRANNPDKVKLIDANSRIKNSSKINSKNAKRRASKLRATLPWINEIHKMQIQWYYEAAKMMTETTGIPHHVDHIHPIQGKVFTGLHVPWNLSVIKAEENLSKGNKLPMELSHLMWESA